MKTKESLASELNGREYLEEITPEECAIAAKSGLVVAFGASDDILLLRGAVTAELDAYNGTIAWIDAEGVIPSRSSIEDGDDEAIAEYVRRKKAAKITIEAKWNKDGYSWVISSNAPYSAFEIVEGDAPIEECKYCLGAVVDVSSEVGTN